jgi:anti-anti-sigma factor
MNLDGDGVSARGLRRYVLLVADELGLHGGGWFVQLDSPINAYVALQRRLTAFPGSDVALSWDEEHGWAVAVESNQGDLAAVGYLAGDVLPRPSQVGRFVDRVFLGLETGLPEPPALRTPGDEDDLSERLAAYAARASTLGEVMTASGNAPIAVRMSRRGSVVVLHVTGELDMLSSPSLAESITSALRERPPALIVDLSGVRFLGSAGLSVLIGAYDQAGTQTRIRVVASNPVTLRPLEVTGLLTEISIHPTVESAISSAREAG